MGIGPVIRTSNGWFDSTVEPTELTSRGVCDVQNAAYVAAFCACYISLLADSPLLRLRGLRPHNRDLWQFKKRLLSMPIRDTVKAYAKVADELLNASHLTGNSTLTGEFIEPMLEMPRIIFQAYLAWYRTGDPELLRYLLSFLRFGKKMAYRDDSLNATALSGWVEVEDRLKSLELPEATSDLRVVLEAVLPPFGGAVWPKFGPGAVAEAGVRGPVAKSGNLSYNPLIDRAFLRSNTFLGDAPPLERVLPDAEEWERQSRQTDMSSVRQAVLRFVPKDVTKARSICMEPNTTMYFQQVVLSWMVSGIESGLLGRYIRLKDQGENQRAAMHGSITGSVDTLDLSSASDSVAWNLVRRVFPRDYVYFLAATRTRDVRLPDGSVRRVAKFAPMGSAVCFPTECVLFAGIIIQAMMQVDAGLCSNQRMELTPDRVQEFLRTRVLERYDTRTAYGGRFEPFRVYGDDLIVDYRVTHRVTELLTSYGFTVNVEKSFASAKALRESCGVYCWAGHDVTPFTHKVSSHGDVLEASSLASYVGAANNAGHIGYKHLQRAYIHIALYSDIGTLRRIALQRTRKGPGHRGPVSWPATSKNPILFTQDPKQSGIYVSTPPTNDHLPRVYNRWLQRDEVMSVWVKEVNRQVCDPDKEFAYEGYTYQQWLRARRFVDADPEIQGSARRHPGETRAEWRWTPTG